MNSSSPRCLWSWVEDRADRTPDAPLAFDEHGRSISFGSLREESERVAAGLLERGLQPGSRVAWILPTRIDSIVLTTALARLDCQQIPLIPAYGRREIAFILAQAAPAQVFVPGIWNGIDYAALAREALEDSDIEPTARTATQPQALPRVVSISEGLPEAAPGTLPPYVARADDPIRWIFYTSGTTSEPKGALHTDGSLVASAIGLERPHAFEACDRVSLVFPYAHIGGPGLLLSALRVGFALILSETFAPEVVMQALARHGVTLAGPGPAFWQAYLEAQKNTPERRLFPELRALIGGGAAKPAHLHEEARRVLGVPILSGYGLTECPGLAYNHFGDPDEVLATDGRAVAGVEIRVVKRDESIALPGEQGEIRVRGPMLFKGYLDARHDEAAFDPKGFLRTGDLGTLDAEGQLRVTGRAKDVIIRKGENISAKEIEDLLGQHPAIADVAVVGLPDQERGERCCAIVVPANPEKPPALDDVTLYCVESGLMRQKHPEQLECVPELPRNSTGKILKTVLREQFGQRD